ncbi:Fe-S protein assembly co-chaperone HscB [Rhodocyclus tenuis]|uniref:Co-chaperone protein HscB homolog n=1 Tax=Rhodocyclus tenuis TaxID=1066 RepID=A0A840G5G1_RHOTE|nr:Fe-S protein assembly co-chaperone HscB [Rhodocyclus tenuis]MBB4247135.1 molecular chaperone HscB [Rhodocyclus tenuis]MBK1678840.1 Fe-S protein assembly co-chaperone HscB [Rhodocyclus tenuis]
MAAGSASQSGAAAAGSSASAGFGSERFALDHFALFDLPQDFRVDSNALDARYRALQVEMHPDRFATAADAERRRALQWATHINEAYQTLKKPLSRARYLLGLLGGECDFARDTSLPMDFLVAQMELRETVADAASAGRSEELDSLRDDLVRQRRAHYEELAGILALAANEQAQRTSALARAADALRRLMFEEKLMADIDDALAALDELN